MGKILIPGFFDLVKEVLQIIRERKVFGDILLIQLLIAVPLSVLIVVPDFLILLKMVSPSVGVALGFVFVGLNILFMSIGSFACLLAAGCGPDISTRALYRKIISTLPAIALLFVLGTLIEIGGLVFFVVPGIVVSLSLGLVLPVLFFENEHGWRALSMSRAYTQGVRGVIVVRYILLFLLFLLIGTVVGLGFGTLSIIATSILPSAKLLFDTLQAVVTAVVNLCAALFSSVFLFCVYRAIKIQRQPLPPIERRPGLSLIIYLIIGIIALLLIALLLISIAPRIIERIETELPQRVLDKYSR